MKGNHSIQKLDKVLGKKYVPGLMGGWMNGRM
jgi:hypothetical protein